MELFSLQGQTALITGSSQGIGFALAEGLAKVSHAKLVHPVEANLMFVDLPRSVHAAARDKGAAYALMGDPDGPGDEILTCRLVCSAQTTDDEVEAFLKVIA